MFVYNFYSPEFQRLLGSRCNIRIVAAFVRKVLDPATRRDENGKASKAQSSIGQHVVREHAGTLGGIPKSKNVSIKGKESSEYAPRRTARPTRSAPTRTAKESQGAKTTGQQIGRKSTRAPGNMKPCGPPHQLASVTESRTKGPLTLRKQIAAPRHCETAFARQVGAAGRHTICSGQ